MNENELEELSRYFRLSDYRDGEYILPDEYEELMDIIRKNKYAKILDDARYDYIRGKITEEEYNELYMSYFDMALEERKIILERKNNNVSKK